MKTMKRIFITILAAGMMFPAAAQTMSLSEEHRLNLDVLRTLETYEASATLRNNDDAVTFTSLFPNDEVRIYNDLIGISDRPDLRVTDYVRLMRNSANSPVITLRNVRKKGVEDGGDKWIVTLTFDKEIRYTNKCGAILSSKGYYAKDYNMEVRIARDKNTGDCVIESLTGNMDSDLPRLGGDFAILERHDPRDLRVTNYGKPIEFNSFDQAFLATPYKLGYYDDDANMKVVNPDPMCNRLSLTYKPLRWRLKPHYDMSIGDYYNLGEVPNGMTATMSGSEFGLDIGYIFPSKGRFKVGLFFGAGYAMSKLNLTANNMSFVTSEPEDVDGDSYERHSTVEGLAQKFEIKNIVVPIYLDFEYRFHTYVSAFFRLGAKAYVNVGSSASIEGGSVTAYGVYPQYGDLVIAENYMNGFGTHSLTDAVFEEDPTFNTASFDAFGGIGVRAKIVGPLSIEAGVNYQYGITDVMNCTTDRNYPIVAYNGSTNNVKNLALELNQVRRSGLRLSLGLMLKF